MTDDLETGPITGPITGSETGISVATQPAFYPPKQQPLMIRLIQSISYPLARLLYQFWLSVADEQVSQVKAVDQARLVYVCNHPTMEDGISLFVLSARLGHLFHYVVAYESFKGLMGWFIQRLGCYSIRRGLGDRASISQTLALLKSPQCRLVIFPEGGCSYQNDTIMPFRPGAVQLPMSVLARQAKKADSLDQVSDLYVVPLSLKYRYLSPMHQVIDSTLARLEAKLNLSPVATDEYTRLRQVAHTVILNIENEANLSHDQSLDWNQRIDRLKQVFIQKCEAALEIVPNLNSPMRERVYKVQALLEDAAIAKSEVVNESLYWNTVRLLNFDAIYDGYVAESPTQERFLDTLTRLEREVFHIEHAQPKAPRRACFYIGEPINLKDYLADYQRDRTSTIEHLTAQLHQTMQSNLNKMASQKTP
ncbi:MAG: 1-acyl-sn-glycerol-3-phosphate acyltransferase [Phormidesmis priestleyi]|uniref:1-acyl-sn-glycerol-3-phosphate acyltransferase n=1 Tax=Phormidesmis priestleyi TaxID=268141 RepID=A0A2W4YP15_9CYAN|nr:MAG: 1-acyl-sn-glycerol-3-phosphate acyltransferase [Phormidesmis priestleyi]